MPRLKDFIYHPISSTLGYVLGWLVHPKSGPLLTKNIRDHYKGNWGNNLGWEDESCEIDAFTLKGVSYTPKGYSEKDGVMICFWGNGDFYQAKQHEMEEFADRFRKKVISYNNRGVDLNSKTRAPIGESDIVTDAVAIADKYINDANRDASLLYGHSLGGAQAVKAGYQLLKEGKGVKVYSWNSLRSISATAREMLAPIARGINIGIGVAVGIFLSLASPFLFPTISFGLIAGATGGFVASFATTYFAGKDINKSIAYTLLLNPLLRLAGWDLNCEKEGAELLKAGKLHYGNIDGDRVIKSGARFADAMDPLIKENPATYLMHTRLYGFDHMSSPNYLEYKGEAMDSIVDYVGPKVKR
tara:strand:+ start:380 stop:1453 length:1074 start_codon:yes stop_codon:yes gene_type:complete